jgi:uncharacterized membrane protein
LKRTEFLEALRDALNGEIPVEDIRNNLDYYDQYIRSEMAEGKSEEEVTDELGDPQLIAKTIIDTAAAGGSASPEGYSPSDGYGPTGDTTGESGGSDIARETRERENRRSEEQEDRDREDGRIHVHQIDFDKWYVRLAAALIVLLIMFLLFLVLGGVFVFIFRYGGVIICFLLIYWLIRGLFG